MPRPPLATAGAGAPPESRPLPGIDSAATTRHPLSMCGRYSLSSTAHLVRETFAVEQAALELTPRWNIAPTQPAPVVRGEADGRRHLAMLRWGLLAESASAPGTSGPINQRGELSASPDVVEGAALARTARAINARSETAASLPAFRESFRARRCLVPADGFYEWLKLDGGRHPFHVRRRDRGLLAMAGLWSRRRPAGLPSIDSFAILTCPPNELMRPLHDRMPAILAPEAWEAWLAAETPARLLQSLLVPWQGDELEAVSVSPFVNRADHEGEECLREVPRPKPAQLALW